MNSTLKERKEKPDFIDCYEFYSLLSEYYENTMDENTKAAFEKHFQHCRACHKFFEEFMQTMKFVGSKIKSDYSSIHVPEDMEARIIEFLKDYKTRKS